MQLELTERKAKIIAVAPNRELHGEDPKPVCFIRISVDMEGDDLAMFHPRLRSLLYEKAKNPDLADAGKDATQLVFPQLDSPLGWNDEMVGAKVIVHYGTSKKSEVNLGGCIVNKVKLEPLEGGTIGMTCTIQAHPNESAMGRLGMMVGTEIPVSIEPPKA